MSGIILTSLHRSLNNKPIKLKEQIDYYQNYWAELRKKEDSRKKTNFDKFKMGDKVEFLYDYDFISKHQEKKYMNDKCFATGIVTELNKEKLEVKVKLKKSCDRKGIIISKYDVWVEIDGEYKKTEENKINTMKKGESKWTSFELWEIVDE